MRPIFVKRNFVIIQVLYCYNTGVVSHYCAGDKIEKNKMGGACSSDRGGERRVQGFGGET
jgi:hypothetical protein